MSKLMMVLGGWLALNAVVVVALLTRRSNPRNRERLFRWVLEDSRTSREREHVQYHASDR